MRPKTILLFSIVSLAGGVMVLAGIIFGAYFGWRGMMLGALVGGSLGVITSCALASKFKMIEPQIRDLVFLGGVFGFFLAIIAFGRVERYSLIPLSGISFMSLGAVAGNYLGERRGVRFDLSRRPAFWVGIKTVIMSFKDMIMDIPKVDAQPIKVDPSEFRVWSIGHSTFFINLYGTTIITDPVLTWWLPIPRRAVPPGYLPAELPKIDICLVSHAHFDHFSRPTLQQLAHKTGLLIIPKHCSDLVADMGFAKIVELHEGESYIHNAVSVSAYQPMHWGQRVPWDRKERGFNTYTITKEDTTIFFAGDTGYGNFFKEIGDHHAIDLAILPIGAYEPRSFRSVHMSPADAVRAFTDLKAKSFIPMHWGSFRLSLEPFTEPPLLLESLADEAGIKDKVHIIQNGQSQRLS